MTRVARRSELSPPGVPKVRLFGCAESFAFLNDSSCYFQL